MLLDERERRFGEAPKVIARSCDYLGCLLDALLSVPRVPNRNAWGLAIPESGRERVVTDHANGSEHADQRARAIVPRGDEQVRLVLLAGYRPGVTWRIHFREQEHLPPFVQGAGHVIHGAPFTYRGV